MTERVVLIVAGVRLGSVGPAAADRWQRILARAGRVELRKEPRP